MKKVGIALSLVLFCFFCLPGGCFADVGSPDKEGSLLIFPVIRASDDTDTLITITNSASDPVWVQCYFTGGGDIGTLVPGSLETLSLSAKSDLGRTGSESFICWASDGVQQISWNHLKGTAEITTGDCTVNIPSWNFAAAPADLFPVGTSGQIRLLGASGQEYDALPYSGALSFDLSDQSPGAAKAILLAGRLDFRTDGADTYTKLRVKYSDQKKAIPFYMMNRSEIVMEEGGSDISATISSAKGRQKICQTPSKPKDCYMQKYQPTPLLGMLEPIVTDSTCSTEVVWPSSSGGIEDTTGFILYDVYMPE